MILKKCIRNVDGKFSAISFRPSLLAKTKLLEKNLNEIKSNWRDFIEENAFKNGVCEISFLFRSQGVKTLRPRQNGRHFADDIFKCIFLNENAWILIKISLKFVPKGSINNIPALVQIMAWRRPGDKPLSEPMLVRIPTHICVTRPQWVNSMLPNISDSVMRVPGHQ